MKKMTLLVLALLLAACSASQPSEFEKNLETWQDNGAAHYRYTLFIGCFCIFMDEMPLTIEVKDGEVVSMTNANGTPVDAAHPAYETFVKYATIERLFSELEAASQAGAATLDVTFDETRGFPATIYIDYDQMIADDELSLEVRDFEVLE